MANVGSNLFSDQLIFLDKSFSDSTDFFEFVFPILKQHGYVKDSFLKAIKAREQRYPTALPTSPYVAALPHTDIEHIVHPFISVTRVAGTAKWHEMANNDNVLEVNFIFLLGFMEKNGHIGLLQTLMECFSAGDLLTKLKHADDPAQFKQLLIDNLKFA